MQIVLLSLLLSSLIQADRLPTGARCEKSNQCVSRTCGGNHVCRPDSAHPGGLGALCEGDQHCLSKNCQGVSCGPPKGVKTGSGSSGSKRGGGGKAEAPEEKSSTPVEEPLPTPTPCSEDLMATVYKEKAGERAYLFYADDNCTRFAPEIIARGKEVFAAGYGRNFGVTLTTLKEATAEQLACAKKAYDKARDPKYPADFQVPSLCLQPQEVIACAQDLATAVFKGDESQGKMECTRRAPAVIATAKAMFAAGYGTSFANLCDVIEKATPEQLACSKRDYELITAGRTKYSGFSLGGVCTRAQAVMDCYFALMSTETKERQYDDRNRSNIEDQCVSMSREDVTLARSMRALGFTQGIYSIASGVQGVKPVKRACLQKLKPAQVTDAEKTDSRFRLPNACAK